jgi:hypothetical protein
LENWWSPIDIYNYKYECRRYFDKLANYPDREPVNVFGTPEENGYLKSSKASFAAYKVFKGLDVAVPEETEPKTEPASEVIEEEVISQDDDEEEIETARSMPTKRKNEEEVGASATKRRKTTSIPVSPKPKQSPKTVSSLPEEPVIKPIDAVKFFESRARFAFATNLFKDEDFPRTLRFARPNEVEFKRPVKKR